MNVLTNSVVHFLYLIIISFLLLFTLLSCYVRNLFFVRCVVTLQFSQLVNKLYLSYKILALKKYKKWNRKLLMEIFGYCYFQLRLSNKVLKLTNCRTWSILIYSPLDPFLHEKIFLGITFFILLEFIDLCVLFLLLCF